MSSMRLGLFVLVCFLGVALMGCGDDGGGSALDAGVMDAASVDAQVVDAQVSPDANALPMSLRDTGLYSDFDGRVIAADVSEYAPAYPLWSDGAVKRRWVYLPPDTTIDTSDMDFWSYPVGTKLWKEFKEGDTYLETRMMWKTGPLVSDWLYVAYAWNSAQDDAVETPDGALDVLGTGFDIPEQRDCRKCHERQPDFVLGFSAIQLAHTGAGVTLDSLITDERLTVNPAGVSPYLPVPGTGTEQAVIGYLHGNCGGCHHKLSDVMDTAKLNLRLETASIDAVVNTTTYTTIVGVANLLSLPNVTALIEPGDPDASAIYVRMNQRDVATQMPPRGSEVIDASALSQLADWISGL